MVAWWGTVVGVGRNAGKCGRREPAQARAAHRETPRCGWERKVSGWRLRATLEEMCTNNTVLPAEARRCCHVFPVWKYAC